MLSTSKKILGWASQLSAWVPLLFVNVQGDQERFGRDIEPILIEYCHDCHGDGSSKGKVSLDDYLNHHQRVADKDLWHRVLKHLQADLMPPIDKPQPSDQEISVVTSWIKQEVFDQQANDPHPGRVTMRRLNRNEYQQTIRDLMGIEFKAYEEFPADDTGYGFDHIGDVLTVSPLLMEKYMAAAEMIVEAAVPRVSLEMAEQSFADDAWLTAENKPQATSRHSFYTPIELVRPFEIHQDGPYLLELEHEIRGDFDFDPGTCQVTVDLNDSPLIKTTYLWQNRKPYQYAFPVQLEQGTHLIRFRLQPLTPIEEKKNNVDLRLSQTRIKGPTPQHHWIMPPNYDRFFHLAEAPSSPAERDAYGRVVLERFLQKAYRRQPDSETVARALNLSKVVWQEDGKTFEDGMAEAFKAILASPRFIFRIERPSTEPFQGRFPYLDDASLASRLSYFLWGTMPDETLLRLARDGRLKEQWDTQIQRLAQDERSLRWMQSFVGQWLQTRDMASVAIDARAVLSRESESMRESNRLRTRLFELFRKPESERTASENDELAQLRKDRTRLFGAVEGELTNDLRQAMQRETEMHLEHMVREDRSVLEWLNCDYAFLNEALANHYGVEGVQGKHMRKVSLPANSNRGGLLTQGTFLAVTSNPSRTSPVKRGLFILDNLLGIPPPPPPPDIPSLEEVDPDTPHTPPTLRSSLEKHREDPLCRSCHQRMDPLGLALETFNPLGLSRTMEFGQPIETGGTLITGEHFESVSELKQVLSTTRRMDFYRCLTEKMLIFALGRGLDYRDTETIDQIVDRLERSGGRFSTLMEGILHSAAFMKCDMKALTTSNSYPNQP